MRVPHLTPSSLPLMSRRLPIVVVLGSTQTLSWASSYYIAAVLADVISRDLSISPTSFFAAFSLSLLISAAIGPKVGRTIDAVGGRGVLALSNVCFIIGLAMLAFTSSQAMLWLAWVVLGVGMGLGLYDVAFAALGRLFGTDARSAITAITLIAGFASTVGWPLSTWGAATIGWRDTCLAWAAAHLVFGLPLNLCLPRTSASAPPANGDARVRIRWDRTMLLLAFSMASAWMVTAAMAAHLPRLLEAIGATQVQAIAAGVLIGPAQVAARIMEAGLLKRFHPLVSARLATAAHPLAAAMLALIGPAAATAFALVHGAGNGILTIARGTVPLAIFGAENYGYRLGLLGAPARIAQACAPLLFGLLIERTGAGALAISAGFSIAAFLALLFVSPKRSG
jgi:predicted MFS family arabinose efflux permease